MNYLSTDHLIVYVSLLLTLVVGLWAGKGIKTIREYAIANKMFGTSVLVLTYLATNLAGASVINTTALVFSNGVIITMALLGLIISFIIRAFFIAPKAVYFRNCITMGDLMKTLYGSYSGIITGVLGLLSSIFLAGMELIILGIVCETLLGIKATWGIVLGGVILTLYSAHGGIKSVATTDVLQFLMLIVGIPLIAYVAVTQVGGVQAVFAQVPAEKFAVFEHKQFSLYLSLFLIWSIFPAGMIDAAIIQRMLMGRSEQQLRNQYLVVAAFDPLFQITIMLIGLAGLVLYPTIKATNVVPHLINGLLPVGFKGATIAGLLAIIMSTVDSYLHVSGLTFVHDVIKPLCDKKKIELNEYRWAQLGTLLLGLIAIAIGLSATDIFGLLLTSLGCTGPLLMFPLIAGMMGLKPEKKAFYIAMFITLFVWSSAKLLLPEAYAHLNLLIGIIANGITFFGVHFVMNKGFATIDRSAEKYVTNFHQLSRKAMLTTLKQCIPTPKTILLYSQNRVNKYGGPYILAGIFCGFNLLVPYFLWPDAAIHKDLLLQIRFIGATLCGLLIVKDNWTYGLQKYMPTFFHFTLLYCLPFTSTVLFLANQGNVAWLVNIALSIILLMVLVDFLSVVLLSILGLLLGTLFYLHFVGPVQLLFHCTSYTWIIYQVIVGVLITLLFTRRKQQNFDQLEAQKQHLADTHTASEQDRLHTLQYQNYLKAALEGPGKAEPLALAKKILTSFGEKVPAEKEVVQKAIDQIEAFVTHYKSTFYYTMDYLRLQVREIMLEHLLDKLYRTLAKEGIQQQVLFQVQTQAKKLVCDPDKMIQLLATSIRALQKQAPKETTIHLQVQDTQLAYQFKALPNQTRALAALAFTLTTEEKVTVPQACYQGNTKEPALSTPEKLSQLAQRENARIIDAHYGYSQSTDSLILHVIPVKLRDIRPKVVDEPPTTTQEASLDDEASIKQEKAFLAQLNVQTTLDPSLVQEVIGHIKQAHQGQHRKSGDLFYTHPMTVASLLLELTQDPDAIVAALLHDAVEDTLMTLEEVQYKYGKTVAFIVDKVTHLDQTFKKAKLTERENQLQLAAHQDPRVVMVKLADRLHNVRTIQFHAPKKQKDIAKETLAFYVPLGRMLDLPAVDKVVDEIEKRCQACLQHRGNAT